MLSVSGFALFFLVFCSLHFHHRFRIEPEIIMKLFLFFFHFQFFMAFYLYFFCHHHFFSFYDYWWWSSTTVSRAKIVEGPTLYLSSGSTLNLTCMVKDTPEPPDYIFWYYNGQVSQYWLIDRFFYVCFCLLSIWLLLSLSLSLFFVVVVLFRSFFFILFPFFIFMDFQSILLSLCIVYITLIFFMCVCMYGCSINNNHAYLIEHWWWT